MILLRLQKLVSWGRIRETKTNLPSHSQRKKQVYSLYKKANSFVCRIPCYSKTHEYYTRRHFGEGHRREGRKWGGEEKPTGRNRLKTESRWGKRKHAVTKSLARVNFFDYGKLQKLKCVQLEELGGKGKNNI